MHRRWNLIVLLLLGLGTGCHLLPIRRIDPSIDPRRVGRPATVESANLDAESATVPLSERSVPLPPLPLLAMSDSEVLEKPAPTPLIDAALERADAMESSLTADPAVEQASLTEFKPRNMDGAAHKLSPDLLDTQEPASEAPLPLPEEPQEIAAADPRPAPEADAGDRTKRETTESSPTPPPVEPSPPTDPWLDGITRLREYATKQVATPGESAEDWRLRQRLLEWLAQDRDRIDRGDASWESVLSILAAATPEDGPVDLRATARALEERAPLAITDLRLCQKVKGFGDFEPLAAAELKPKQLTVLYCELSGVESKESKGTFRSELEASIELRSAGSETPVWTQALGRRFDTCTRKRLDYYVGYRFSLPETIAPGSYVLTIHQHDVEANRDVTASMDLVVKAAP